MIQKLLNSYGEELLRYIFSIPDNENFPIDEKKLDKETLDLLISYTLHDNIGFSTSLLTVSRYIPEYKTSIFNYLHIKNNGSPVIVQSSQDKLLNVLYKLLSDVWPIYLYNSSNQKEISSTKHFIMNSATTSALYNHDLITSACKYFLEDQSLQKLFPGVKLSKLKVSEYTMVSSEWITSIGNGGTQQILSAISSLFFQTATRCIILEKQVDYLLLCKYLGGVVNDWKKLANGKEVQMFGLFGLGGFTVDENIIIKCNNIIIRPPTKYELNVLLDYETPPQLVVEKKISMKLDVLKKNSKMDEIEKWYKKNFTLWNESFINIQQEIDKIKLSLILASNIENKQFIMATENSRFIENPIQNSGRIFGLYKFYNPVGEHLTKEMAKEVEYWYEHVIFDKLNIGIKKLLSAMVNRPDPNDAFIDAIIVWENIFGSRTETTFRVTASLAKLLEKENVEKRKKLQKELKTLYSLRSDIVHGVKELPVDKAHEFKDRVLIISIQALRTLFKERPDLISYDSEIRSQTILLEG